MPNMTGRPGYRTSSAPYLARTPFVPLFLYIDYWGWKQKRLVDYQGRAGIISILRWKLRPVIFGVEIPWRSPSPLLHFQCVDSGKCYKLGRKSGWKKQPKDKVFGHEIHGTSGTRMSGNP